VIFNALLAAVVASVTLQANDVDEANGNEVIVNVVLDEFVNWPNTTFKLVLLVMVQAIDAPAAPVHRYV
jgi:hypothetical protein